MSVFSYLESARKIVSETVYTRGLKYYLSGKVVDCQDLTLDNWRRYNVLGSYQAEYLVVFPVLHLLLNPKKFDLTQKVIQESVTCDCPYFYENGTCKHIVAVAASLENEFFKPAQKPEPKDSYSTTQAEAQIRRNLLDKIFQANQEKKQRYWEDGLWRYLNYKSELNPQVLEFLENLPTKAEEYKDFQKYLIDLTYKALKTYESELKVLKLIEASWSVNAKFWFPFWLKFLPQLSSDRQAGLWQKAWVKYFLKSSGLEKLDLPSRLKALDSKMQSYILQKLQKDYPRNNQIWLDFILVIEDFDWFQENLKDLDPIFIFKVLQAFPELGEAGEIIIQKQVKTWSDFLIAGDYKDLIKVMQTWKSRLGETENYLTTKKYIQESHPKKKSLLKDI